MAGELVSHGFALKNAITAGCTCMYGLEYRFARFLHCLILA